MLPKFLKSFCNNLVNRSKDPLTKLYTHKDFYRIVHSKVQSNKKFSLIMIDIENFGEFNTEKGFASGDKILAGIAEILTKMTRRYDRVCRFGGDEFAVVLPNVDKISAIKIAELLQNLLSEYMREVGSQLEVSIGIACYPSDAIHPEGVVRSARLAQFKAKCAKEKGVVPFSCILDIADSDFDNSDLTSLNSIKTLINIVNIKDKYTYGHSKRVAQYCCLLGKKVGLEGDRLNSLLFAAYLHDIGKIGIDEEILIKPERLTKIEFEKIKRHPEFAVEIIRPISSLDRLIPGILHHHEKYDGTGYPQGLKKDEISLEGKIIQVADSFDAMTSRRPYQKQMGYMEAWQEVKRCSGTQFDPELVYCFSKVMENASEEFNKSNFCSKKQIG